MYYCSELHYNLMSINQIKVKKYTCSIKNNKFQFMNAKSIITFVDLRNKEKV